MRGDADAFARLAERDLADLHRMAAAMVGLDDARDVAQETLLTAWRHLPKLRRVDRYGSWLRSMLVNRCRNHLRDHRRAPPAYLTDDPASLSPRYREDPIAGLHAAWAVADALATLRFEDRAVLTLHYLGGLSIREVADVLGLRPGTAKTRLHSGLEQLRRLPREVMA